MSLRRRLTPSVPYTLEVINSDKSVEKFSFRLAYDLNALALVEDKLGLSPTADLEVVFFGKSTARIAITLLWAALQLYHPDYAGEEGYETVGSLLTVETMGRAKDACWDAYLTQLAPEKAEKFRQALEDFKKAQARGAVEESPNAASPETAPAA